MQQSDATLAGALQAARRGIADAQAHAASAAQRQAGDLPRTTPDRLIGEPPAPGGSSLSSAASSSHMLDDMVELSNSASAVKANAAVFRTASGLSLDVVNLGRRIDIRA